MQNQALYYFENMKNKNLADYILPVLKPAVALQMKSKKFANKMQKAI